MPAQRLSIEAHLPVGPQLEYGFELRVDGVGATVAVAPGTGPHKPAFRGKRRPAPLARCDHLVQHAEAVDEARALVEGRHLRAVG